jgi:hypothetical protein
VRDASGMGRETSGAGLLKDSADFFAEFVSLNEALPALSEAVGRDVSGVGRDVPGVELLKKSPDFFAESVRLAEASRDALRGSVRSGGASVGVPSGAAIAVGGVEVGVAFVSTSNSESTLKLGVILQEMCKSGFGGERGGGGGLWMGAQNWIVSKPVQEQVTEFSNKEGRSATKTCLFPLGGGESEKGVLLFYIPACTIRYIQACTSFVPALTHRLPPILISKYRKVNYL